MSVLDVAAFVTDFVDHPLVQQGYEPAEIAYAEAMLSVYRSLRILQLMDESGHQQWEELTRDDVQGFIDTTAVILGLTPGEQDSDAVVLSFIEQRTGRLARMPYREYLQTPEWKDVRRFALYRAGGRCQVCNHRRRLQVHHRDYVRRGHERLDDVTVLCADCHGAFHRERGMPSRGDK